MSQNILVINQYYAPDVASSGQILADLCEGLVSQGHTISMVCGQPSYEKGAMDVAPKEKLGGVDVYRTSMGFAKGRSNFLFRILGYLIFLWQAWLQASVLIRKENFDVVITLSNPPFVGVIGALISRQYKIRYLAVVYDIHPDVVQATGWIKLPRFIFSLWNQAARWILKHAEKVVVLGEGMKETLIDTKGVQPENISVIPIWGIPEISVASERTQYESSLDVRKLFNIGEEDFLVLFAGNIGIMQPVDDLVEAAKKCTENRVRFLILGGGVGFDDLRDTIKSVNLNNLILLRYQPQDVFQSILIESDICVVTLAKGMEKYSVPSRAFTFMSAGKPIVAGMAEESDIGSIIKENDCGWIVNSGSEMVDIINSCLNCPDIVKSKGQNGYDYYHKELSKTKSIERFSRLIVEMKSI